MQRYPPALSASGEGPRVRPASPGSAPRPRPAPSGSRADEEEDRRRPHARKGSLPLYSGAGAGGRVLSGKGRLRWLLVAALALMVLLWRYRATELKEPPTIPPPAPPRQEDDARPTIKAAAAAPEPQVPKKHDDKAAAPPTRPPAPIKVVDIDVRRSQTTNAEVNDDEPRYLAYSPHSGYHNQRISLENAFTLAFMLGRILLVPPVWVGHAIPYISFDKLGRRLEMASNFGLDRCKEFGEGGSEDPVPRECEGYWSWTQVGWDFLVDLAPARKLVPVRERWNHTDAWLAEELGLRKGKKGQESPDAFRLTDDTMYQYRFYDSVDDDEPLAKFENRVEIDQLAEETKDFKLLHVGSLFGTSRLRVTQEDNFDARSTFRRAMVFKNELLDEITETIRDRLGGAGLYYGLHLRVGDGVFQKEARSNMAAIWTTLCTSKMKLDAEVCEEMAELSEGKRGGGPRLTRRSEPPSANVTTSSTSFSSSLVKRANSRPQRAGAFKHAPLPPLPVIRTSSDSPLDSSLTCRSPLHSEPRFLPFNAPLFIATDSKLPTSDPNLAIFFDSFPCTFTLGDFGSLPALEKLNGLRNREDKTPLAQFLYPQLDAQIAAWGRGLVGTPQSTYSRFAVDVLHQVYHGWDIVERG